MEREGSTGRRSGTSIQVGESFQAHSFADLVDTVKLQELMSRLYEASGIPIGIIDVNGAVHVATGWQDICTRFHRCHPTTAARCRESDEYIMSHLHDSPHSMYRCKNGLWDCAVPILVEQRHVATLFVGQFHFDDDQIDRDFFRSQAEEFEFDTEEYLRCLDRLPVFSRSKIQAILAYYQTFVGYLIDEGVNRLERLRSERRARESEQRLNSIVDGTNDAIYIKDVDGRYVLVNREVERAFGRSRAEILGRDDAHLFPANQGGAVIDYDRQVMQQLCLITHEESLTTVDGERLYLSTKGPLRTEDGQLIGLFGISRDITEHRRLQERLLHSQKIESVGRLAGGIAHDFNNTLTVILGCSEIAKTQAEHGSELMADLDEIIRAAGRSRDIVAQLLAFSRQQIISPRPVDVNRVIRQTRKSLMHLIGEDVTFLFTPGEELWSVRIDPAQFDQVVVNLTVNARDAMPTGGRFVIETQNVTARDAQSQGAREGEYVRIRFADNGIGMDKDTLGHVFEPFYTTKCVGQGTGLGLATVYGIVSQNAGFIEVQSEPGKGSVFSIYLPRFPGVTPQNPIVAMGSISGA